MARDFSCQNGQPFKTKADAIKALPEGTPVRRCDRCRWWHLDTKKAKRGRR